MENDRENKGKNARQFNSENSSEATDSPEQRKNWGRMDMYINPSEHTIDHQTNDLFRQNPSAPLQTSGLESQYIAKDTIVSRESDEFYSPILGEVSSELIPGAGYNSGFPESNDDNQAILQAIMPQKDKPALKNKPSIGDTGSSTVGSPFNGQFFQTGGSDGIALGGPDSINLNAGGSLAMPYSRVNTRRYERIDRIAMKLFPLIFILVNVCYWCYYLLLHETFQELW